MSFYVACSTLDEGVCFRLQYPGVGRLWGSSLGVDVRAFRGPGLGVFCSSYNGRAIKLLPAFLCHLVAEIQAKLVCADKFELASLLKLEAPSELGS